jgi:2-keto-4-pentenoate hydratase/2-oxohepta-3-ene-1,7-dioic acid hydratase in catechol pathway
MRICRFGNDRLGVVEDAVEGTGQGTIVRDVTAALGVLPSYRYPLPAHDVLIANLDTVKARACQLLKDAPQLPLGDVRLLSPVANPGKIIAAPVNYQAHLDEVKVDPQLHQNNRNTLTIQSAALFLKATSSLAGAGEGIVIRHAGRRNDHEVELVVVIGRTADRVARQDAMAYVAGYAVGLDITVRGTEDRSFRKSVDTFSVVGPWLVTADEIADPGGLDLQITVNGEVRQKASTRQLILGVAELIELASSFYTLHPGDIIFTGTPEGVGPIQPGDRIVAHVASVGTMTVDVRG